MKTEMYCYLENREQRVLPSNEAFERWLAPEKTAIACIDMHRGHVGPDDELTLPAPRARAKIPAHNLFHALARAIDIPIMVQDAPMSGTARYQARTVPATKPTSSRVASVPAIHASFDQKAFVMVTNIAFSLILCYEI